MHSTHFANCVHAIFGSAIPSHEKGSRFVCEVTWPQWFVPRESVPGVLKHFHEEFGGHQGMQAMRKAIEQRHFWDNLFQDIKRHCQSCVSCAEVKAKKNVPQNPLTMLKPSSLRERAQIDLFRVPRCSLTGAEYDFVLSLFQSFFFPARFFCLLILLLTIMFSRYLSQICCSYNRFMLSLLTMQSIHIETCYQYSRLHHARLV